MESVLRNQFLPVASPRGEFAAAYRAQGYVATPRTAAAASSMSWIAVGVQ